MRQLSAFMKTISRMFTRLRPISLFRFWVIVSALYCLVVESVEFWGVPVSDGYSMAVTGMQWLLVSFCAAGLLMLICSYRILFAVVFPILLTVSGIMCYFYLSVGTRITAVSIEVAMVNDFSMWRSVISPVLICVVAGCVIVSAFAVACRWRKVRSGNKASLIMCVAGFLVVMCPVLLVRRIQAPVGARLPYSLYFAFREYLDNRKAIAESRDTYDAVPSEACENAPDVIFIMGEALRADHLPVNGYGRNTMPLLWGDTSLVSYPDIYSEHTYTYVSVPHIMTGMSAGDVPGAYESQSFITLLNKAGYSTAWFANQDISDSYAYFAHECDTLIYCNTDGSLYSYDRWLDADMMPAFGRWYGGDDSRPRFALLHSIGSHWWYKSHYLPRHALFLPDISHKDIGGLSEGELVNAYDNTIIATDEFINSVIELLRDRNAIMFYVSDHGEALGEDGQYLHGAEADPIHRPACLVWYSERYRQHFPDKVEAMKRGRTRRYNTEDVFHTILDLAAVKTPAMNKERSFLQYDL